MHREDAVSTRRGRRRDEALLFWVWRRGAALENEIGRVDRLCCEVVWSAEDGRSNVQDILRVFWKKGGACVFVPSVSVIDADRALVRLGIVLDLRAEHSAVLSPLFSVLAVLGVFAWCLTAWFSTDSKTRLLVADTATASGRKRLRTDLYAHALLTRLARQ